MPKSPESCAGGCKQPMAASTEAVLKVDVKILFLNYEYPPIGGGGANANAYLFREFARMSELRIDCVTSTMAAQDEVVHLTDNIILYRLAVGKKQLHYWTQGEVLRWLWRSRRQVKRLLRENRYDVCHAFFAFPSGAIAWGARGYCPYLVSLRGSDVPGFNPRFAAQYVVLKPLFRRIWRQAQAVVANSEGLKQLAARLAPELPLQVIPNGIDTEEFFPAPCAELVAPRILCVSRLVERKGVQHLIEAFPSILQAVPRARLTIVGEGNLLEPLRRRVVELGLVEAVVLVGHTPHDELPALYRQAGLFVLPSYYEGMSNTVLEAMASGLPIVASGEGGREELLRENALLVPFADPATLAAAIVALLLDPKQRTAMGAASRVIAEEFSWSAVAQRYVEIYGQIAQKDAQCAA